MSEQLYRIEYRKIDEPDTFVAILPDGGLLVPFRGDLMTRAEWEATTKPTYYQTSKGIDPEDVLIDWLTKHGVDKENAYNMAHHLVHSVLYSAARAVKRAAMDAQFWPDDDIEEDS